MHELVEKISKLFVSRKFLAAIGLGVSVYLETNSPTKAMMAFLGAVLAGLAAEDLGKNRPQVVAKGPAEE